MNEAAITLPKLLTAYELWSGKPVASLQLRRNEASDRIPTEMDVLFFQPEETDNVPEEEFFTSIATAGMSTRAMPGSGERAELVLRVQGKYPLDELQKLGRKLAELAVVPFREETSFAPNLVVSDISFPLFDKMSCALITNWGVYSPEYLPDIRPPVQLLWVKPIYEEEAEVIEKIGDEEAARRFMKEHVNWDDPKRGPAHLGKAKRKRRTRSNEKRG